MPEDEVLESDVSNVVIPIENTELFQGVKWQLWFPVIIGLIASVISKLTFEDIVAPQLGLTNAESIENGTLLFSGVILTFVLSLLSLKLYGSGNRRIKFIMGGGISVMFFLFGIVLFKILCWAFIIIFWLIITIIWGQYRLSPPRTGIWLGAGGAVSIVLGNLIAHLTL